MTHDIVHVVRGDSYTGALDQQTDDSAASARGGKPNPRHLRWAVSLH